MSYKTLIIDDTLQHYLETVTVNETSAAKALREKTKILPTHIMQISPEQGQFMALLIRLMNAKRVLELGTYTGYSALVMAEALPENGKLITCDIDEANPAIAKIFWDKAGLGDKIEFRLGAALDTLDGMIAICHSRESGHPDLRFDFIFIDADKGNYDEYYEKALQLLNPGGVIALDNMLWSGKVADPDITDKSTTVIRNLNTKISQDERVTSSLVPIGDGMMVVLKR